MLFLTTAVFIVRVVSWASGMAVLLADPQSSWLGAKETGLLSGCSSPVVCISLLSLSLSARVLVGVAADAATGMGMFV